VGDPSDRLLVALDVDGLDQATSLLENVSGVVTGCKIGNQLFTAAGPAAVEAARKRGFRVFLDLKYHDIPNTVAGAVREATRLGVFMLNVHAGGGLAMMRAAAEAATRAAKDLAVPRPICLGVTVLTSLDRHALDAELGIVSTVESHVLRLAGLAKAAGLDGCVASAREIGPLRLQFGKKFVIVTPGIRARRGDGENGSRAPRDEGGLGGSGTGSPHEKTGPPSQTIATPSADDQVRTATAAAAIEAGADYIVVGRPITAAPNPRAAAQAVLEELSG
jgi:orotidine-5'-phosphate decarboxylase